MNNHITRRGFVLGGISIFTASGLASQSPSCQLASEQEEGPYYIDYEKVRRNLTEEKPGVPLQLRIALVDARRCAPLGMAAVDIWHCDAQGVYSGFTGNGGGENIGRGGPGGRVGPGGRGRGAVDETRFLRGIQITNREGLVEFSSVYPGWYAGRTIHIHLKVHLGGDAAGGDRYAGGHVSHTGQLFFPEDITAEISKLDPYMKHSSVHRTLHSEDHVFLSQGGAQSMVKLERLQPGSNDGGFLATATLAVDPGASPSVL
jgi:protocatechuate 3,4-dioxygenase beta subunit